MTSTGARETTSQRAIGPVERHAAFETRGMPTHAAAMDTARS
jgi:hypothetical protein